MLSCQLPPRFREGIKNKLKFILNIKKLSVAARQCCQSLSCRDDRWWQRTRRVLWWMKVLAHFKVSITKVTARRGVAQYFVNSKGKQNKAKKTSFDDSRHRTGGRKSNLINSFGFLNPLAGPLCRTDSSAHPPGITCVSVSLWYGNIINVFVRIINDHKTANTPTKIEKSNCAETSPPMRKRRKNLTRINERRCRAHPSGTPEHVGTLRKH